MANPFFTALLNGNIRMPDAAINHGGGGPFPSIPTGATQFSTPDGQYNMHGLPTGSLSPYSYGKAARISTQTQMAHPNRVQLIIPKLYLPSPQSDIANMDNPVLEHSISDGDLVFSFRMTPDMTCYGSQYFAAPYGYSSKAVPLINLATVNYILWGLQVGLRLPRCLHWKLFFSKLLHNHPILNNVEHLSVDHVWNFLKTYIRPFGIQHGGDTQGGRHEGETDPIVTHGAADYVSSYAIEGKLLHVNNLWRDYDVHEGDDLILSLTRMEAPHADVFFDLSSSTRSHRTERTPITNGWFFLRPSVREFKSFADAPHIHIGRSQKYCSLYSRGQDMCCWNARMCVVPGAPLQLTFEPGFVQSDDMFYAEMELEYEGEDDTRLASRMLDEDIQLNQTDPTTQTIPNAPPPFHLLPMAERRKRPVATTYAAVVAGEDEDGAATKVADAPPPKPKKPKHTGGSILSTGKPKPPQAAGAAAVSFDFSPDGRG